MKNKIDMLQERITIINNMLGELDTEDLNNKTSKNLISKDKFKNLSDAIVFLQKEVSENDTIHFQEVNKKFEEISPLLDPEKLKDESNLQDKEMYFLLMSNFEELQTFLKNLNYVKKNQKYLELNPIVDGQDKIKKLKPLELKTMSLESKMTKMTDNIDNLLQNYNETIEIINKKFALYNLLLDKK